MSDIIALLNQGLSPLIVILIVLIVYFLNELKNKINKVDQIDLLIMEIKNLVLKLEDLVETQKENKKDTDEQIEALRKEDESIKNDIRGVMHRLVKLETLAELEKGD